MKFEFPIKIIDWYLVLAPIVLVVFGIIVIYSLSTLSNSSLAVSQSIYAGIGIISAGILLFINYRTWYDYSYILYIINCIVLLLVLFMSETVFGANSRIDFGFFELQPAEPMKYILLFVLARFLSDNREKMLKKILGSLVLIGIPFGLILFQPDLGSASVLLVSGIVMLLVSKVSKTFVIAMVGLVLVMAPIGYQVLAPYQQERVLTFLNPGSDPTGSGYNVVQSQIAIGSGGVWGRGLGEGSQSQLDFLPVAHTDFIFAGAAEATGFIGAMLLLILLMVIVVRCVMISGETVDSFARLFTYGLATIILYQIFINAGGNLGLVPVTGIPLPFVSFGGSSIISAMAVIGIVQSIYMRTKRY